MAGLTREQRAEREAAKLAEQKQEDLNPEQPEEATVDDASGVDSEKKEEIAFLMMKRDPDKYDAPHTAQVHPDEVINYYSGGWVVDKD